MIPLANRYTVVLDASVLFPNMKRDLLLCFFEADLYRAQWTERIQQEWLTRAIEKYPDNEDSLRRTDALMRGNFESAWIRTEYEPFIDAIHLPDPNDRHVVAAAIVSAAQYIVTDNVRHFPAETLTRFGLEAGTADKFLAGTFEHYVRDVLGVLRDHRRGLKTRPSPAEYLMMLRQKQMPRLASHLMPYREAI